MHLHYRQLTRILRFLMYRVKRRHFTESSKRHISTHKFHLLVGFCLLGFFAFKLSNIEASATEKVNITKVAINGTALTSKGGGVYVGTVSSGTPYLQVSIYSDDYKKLTEYHLQASISFTYPHTVGPFLNVTPIYSDGETHFLAEIGTIQYQGTNLSYHTKDYYNSGGYLFNHGGYFTTFGGSATSQTLITDLTYQFNTSPSYIGLYFENVNGPNKSPAVFPTAQRSVTVTIDYLDATEKAIIENAETTKNIFEWLQDGFTKMIVPTSDGIEEMLENTSKVIENRLGVLYLPFDFIGSALGAVKSAFENASSDAFTVPSWKVNINNHNYTMWNEFTFSITNNAIFKKIFIDYGLILLVKITYLVFFFISIFKTINLLTDGILALEIEYFFSDMFDDSDAIDGEWREL